MKQCIKCDIQHSRNSKFCSKKCTTAHWYIQNKHKELKQKKKYHKANKDKGGII